MLTIKKLSSPGQICSQWDVLADNLFLKKSFLTHLHCYNFCNQRYYELYENSRFVAGTIVYTLKVNILTYSELKLFVPMQVIGMPVSIATEPLVGNSRYAKDLLQMILKNEKGLILGINFKYDYLRHKVVNLRTLPTIFMDSSFDDFPSYVRLLRHPYRRKINKCISGFKEVLSVESDCGVFSQKHYAMYLNIMKKTTTRLEVLSYDFFRNLPSNFLLTTHYIDDVILAWHICTVSSGMLYFVFGGLNYEKRDQFNSYNNNLLSIVSYAIQNNCKGIDFGQTAELSKMRLGGTYGQRRMFLFHKFLLVRVLIKFFSVFISYSKACNVPRVFKTSRKRIKSQSYEDNICQAQAI